MKKVITIILAAALLISCQKQQVAPQQIMGLTLREIGTLETMYPKLSFDMTKQTDKKFASLQDAINFAEGIKNVSMPKEQFAYIFHEGATISQCGSGFYTAHGISGGGFFSSFTASFAFTNGSTSSFTLGTSGFNLGWSWNSVYTYSSGLTGYVYGYAEYNYAILKYSDYYSFEYSFNPNSCALTYKWNQA